MSSRLLASVLFTGEQFDPHLGLYYLRARYNNVTTGWFWSIDSYEGRHRDPATLHKYIYCHAEPVNGIDPSGHRTRQLWIGYTSGPTTAAAYHFAPLLGTLDGVYVKVESGDDIYSKVFRKLSGAGIRLGAFSFDEIDISGHGRPGDIGANGQNTAITLESLTNPGNTPQKRLLSYLRRFVTGQCKVTLRACQQAKGVRGKRMMSLIARRLNATVVGWDDTYAIRGYGNKRTVTAAGIWSLESGAPWKGSLFEYIYSGRAKRRILSTTGGYNFSGFGL